MSVSEDKEFKSEDEKYSSDEDTVDMPIPGFSINDPNGQAFPIESAASRRTSPRKSAPPKLTEEQKEKKELKALAERLFSLEADPQIGNVAKDIAVNIFRHMTSGEDPKSNEELLQLKTNAIDLLSSKIPELKELNDLAKNILKSASTPETQKLAGSIFAYINCSVYGLELTPGQEKLMQLAKNLVTPSSTSEQLEIAEHVFTYLVGNEGIGAVVNASSKYIDAHRDAHRLHRPGLFFFRKLSESDTAILDIHKLAINEFRRECKSSAASAPSAKGLEIRDFEGLDDEDVLTTFGSLALGSSTPERTVEFFNTSGNENFLFVRMSSDSIFEADILLSIAKGTPDKPIRHWMSATAIKNRVPFRTYHDSPIGFLYSPDTSVADVTVRRGRGDEQFKKAWGTKNLNNSSSSYFFNLTHSDEVYLTALPNKPIPTFEEEPIGEKLEEIRKRISGEWPDLTTKELKAFLWANKGLSDDEMVTEIKKLAPKITDADLAEIISLRGKLEDPASFERKDPTKAPTRYSSLQAPLPNNEVFIHPTIENMLGIVIISRDYLEEARKVQKHFEENGGPHFPIFLYAPGELTLVEA